MKLGRLKYLAVFSLPIMVWVSFFSHGWLTYLPLFYAFGVIPLADFLTGENANNLLGAEREDAKRDWLFDLQVYLVVPVHVGTMIGYFLLIGDATNSLGDFIGKSVGMGIMCGVMGINVAHELGHRTTKAEQFLSKILLASTSFLHFYIEHNRGHHRNVGTPMDAATARKNESVYLYWLRVFPESYFSAWNIVKKERERKKLAVWSLSNEFLQYQIIQALICLFITWLFGWQVLVGFLIASLVGMLLLETVNYIEHYGLSRKMVSEFRYEDVQPKHSWNADYVVGRLVLFELTRHSDHHYEPSKHYQTLDSMSDASQLPAGYPAMMLLSLLPPIWFRVMNKRLPA